MLRNRRSARRLLAGALLALTVLAVPVVGALATGRATLVATHGVSMNPVYYQGDLVVVARADNYQVGDIVAYRVPSKHVVVLHRIIGGNAAGFVMKGDNNPSIDPSAATATDILGRAVVHIPHGGLWLERLTHPITLALVAFVIMAGGGTAIQTRRRRKRAAMSRHATLSTGPLRSMPALPPHLNTTAVVALVLGVLGLAVGVVSWVTPASQSVDRPVTTTRTMTFTYTADVTRSPAYDATTVQSPDPVFRRLTNTVDLHLAYQASDNAGPAASVSVAAELSTPGGWHSSVPVAAPVALPGNRYDATVRLDLNAFDARARSAATVTGLPAGPVTVAITPTVHTAGAPWTPTLRFTLTPLQLSLAGDPTSLTVRDSVLAQHSARTPRTLGLLGHHITVTQARALSAALLLAAILAATAVALIARRGAADTEGATIRRRYPALLVAVHPITTPTDQRLIEVVEFATLAKLAERSGLLILHWSRSCVETFTVIDENTTYRYRTGTGDPTAITPQPASATASTPPIGTRGN